MGSVSMSFIFPELPTWLLNEAPSYEFVRTPCDGLGTDTKTSLLTPDQRFLMILRRLLNGMWACRTLTSKI